MNLYLECDRKYIEVLEYIDYENPIDNLFFAKNSSVALIFSAYVLRTL